jgi:hypothetical protein
MANEPDPRTRPVLTTQEARQGTTRFPLRHVLAVSLALAVIVLVIAFLVA